eukprot:gb/GECG01006735.1/.p1 GENE.gb/GECG01006735.1/~~gb/GECG01006735.1/.p1  ORF type:complete len:321 (+),score=51.11 gb/GECG01006735.1/:1-963(+)
MSGDDRGTEEVELTFQEKESKQAEQQQQNEHGEKDTTKEYNKKMDKAKSAFEQGDIEASIAAHDEKARLAPEDHGGVGSDVIKSIVFGGLDGIITTFATVAAVAGSGLDVEVLILLGLANLIGDAISMGVGDFLSSKAETEHVWIERDREKWEYENYPEGEKQEMIDIYINKGIDPSDAKLIIDTYTKKPEYADLFIDHMMVEELGLMVPEAGAIRDHAKEGLVTFCSFLIFGSVPLWFYVLLFLTGAHDDETDLFALACVVTFITLFGLGVVKGKITRGHRMKSGFLLSLNGALAAGSAFFVGLGLEKAFEVDNLSGGC